ncbi:hypothetical protein CEUSTIGMA_g6495.t1 [Chlamydomonas eustigma]|uniref:Glycosyl hydrolase family 13 catalytic domain-containing protein n=1 Tax=Chlamydomonas eustigma TaxID=1157962 RepID=A0A250X7L8_9CHLO|nr:hypothetical protein CEUSTIGMA_g6495.t1 [Chlamydomonas eustigma]|eukprot:GAX79055.1 hypothetical protein CEUSTIGMA_g6495.t1 [Chlamydomonas eustigma]
MKLGFVDGPTSRWSIQHSSKAFNCHRSYPLLCKKSKHNLYHEQHALLQTLRHGGKAARTSFKQQASATPLITGSPPSVVASFSVWSTPSEQPAGALYSAPLCGRPLPLGAHAESALDAVNFSVFSSSATFISLCLFTEPDLQAGIVTAEIPLNPELNRTGDVWHIMVPGLKPGLLYGYRVSGLHQDGPELEGAGHRHDSSCIVLDPLARSIISRRRYGQLGPDLQFGNPGVLGLMRTWPQAAAPVPSVSSQNGGPGSEEAFDWQGDRPLGLAMEKLVIYEMHVRGFTQDSSSRVSSPGTYQGMIEKLDYLRELGVNAVELLPVQEFNELEYYSQIPGSDAYRFNYWGYSTIGYFAPMSRYSDAAAKGKSGQAVQNEFKTLVRECHRRGIEVILDVVFNHTAEGNDMGPTLSFRGLDNRVYYMLAPGGEYYNYSGCGNTFNCNHPVVRQFIVDCLRYWVLEYHVDGFRFDLASIMTRAHSAWHPTYAQDGSTSDSGQEEQAALGAEEGVAWAAEGLERTVDMEGLDPVDQQAASRPMGAMVDPVTGNMTNGGGVPTGTPLSDPPLIDMISEDPILRGTKLIAEAWDCDGLNQVGAFPHYGGRWSEWNGRFRDVVRNFIKGTDGPWAGDFASAICGSPNLYANSQPHETDWWGNNGGRKWRGGRSPSASVNFITAHDGFTLADLVSYNEKHNEANGEDNRDGESHNCSWNCGEEGINVVKWDVKRLRQRQMRNFMVALLVSHGVPMLHMGDEYGHSKGGNNNTYCHDSTLNWLNWSQALEDATGFQRFTKHMVQLRMRHPELQRSQYVTEREIQWHGEQPNTPDWSESSRLVAFSLNDFRGGGLYVAFNTAHTPRLLNLPRWQGIVWQPLVDSSKVAPYDFLTQDKELSETEVIKARVAASMWTAENVYPVLPWSCIVLEAVPEVKAQIQKSDIPGSASAYQ